MQKIKPFLWFDDQAEEAMEFYLSVFKKDAKRGKVIRNDDGSVMSVTFKLGGVEYYALNGGPHFKFTPAISLFVSCKTQREVDYYWDRLSRGGKKSRCGWLTDKFGLSWQVVPDALGELMHVDDEAQAERVFEAMMGMTKLDIKGLERAARGPRPAARRKR